MNFRKIILNLLFYDTYLFSKKKNFLILFFFLILKNKLKCLYCEIMILPLHPCRHITDHAVISVTHLHHTLLNAFFFSPCLNLRKSVNKAFFKIYYFR